jgi:diacylglycerol O-acyltransferase / wax synthase
VREVMTPLEAVMWRAGAAPDLRADFASVTILARPPGRARLRQALAQAAAMLPTLRRTVRTTGWPPGQHEWIDDPAFEVDNHLRHVAVPGAGRQDDLLNLVAELSADPLPADRPSWEVVVVDGLDGGAAAVVQRLHHTVADGVDAVRLWRRLLSDEQPSARSGAGSTGAGRAAAAIGGEPAHPSPGPARAPGPTRAMRAGPTLAGVARQGLATGLSVSRTAARTGLDLTRAALDPRSVAHRAMTAGALLDPRALAGGALAARRLADELRGQVVMGGQLSPVMRQRSARHELDVLSVPGDALRSAARDRGVGPNDALVAAVAAALGDYHIRLGHECHELRFAVPVRRGGNRTGRNGFTPMRFVLPVTPAQGHALLPSVADGLGRARTSSALALTEPLAAALNLLPGGLLAGAVRNQSRTVDVAVSLVIGMRAASLAGAPIEATYPFGPRLGAALNVTALPMGDRLDLGINSDPAAVTEPEVLMACLRRSFGELAGQAPAPRSSRSRSSRRPGTARRTAAAQRQAGSPRHQRSSRGRPAPIR